MRGLCLVKLLSLALALAECVPMVALRLPLGNLGGLKALDRCEGSLNAGNHFIRPEHFTIVAPMRRMAIAIVIPIINLGNLVSKSVQDIPARGIGKAMEVGGGGENGLNLGLVGFGRCGAGEQFTPEEPKGGGGFVGGEDDVGHVFLFLVLDCPNTIPHPTPKCKNKIKLFFNKQFKPKPSNPNESD